MADSFKPLHSRWKHTLVGDSESTYGPGKVTVEMKGSGKPKDIELKGGLFYDNEECVQLFRRLPLTSNYNARSRSSRVSRAGPLIPLGITVQGIETVTVPAGTFECFKVELSLNRHFIIRRTRIATWSSSTPAGSRLN